MFLNSHFVVGRSGISKLMFTSLIVLIFSVLAFGASAQDGGVLRIGINAPENLDPATGTADSEILFNRTIYDFLVETTPSGEIAPNLATDWTVSDDGLVWTFNLAEGVTFHDGSPMTAADVVYTFNRLQELETQAANLMGVYTVEAVDDSTVQFTLEAVNADFLYGVATQGAVVIKDGTEDPNVIADGDDPFANFNGTGPFILTDYSPGEIAVFARNDNYWKEGQPLLDGLEFLFIADSLTQADALRSGAVDAIFRLDVDLLPTLEGEDGINVVSRATNLHPVVRIRSDEGALGEDPRIREAFKLATNREELLETVQEGRGVVGNNDPIGPKYGAFYAGMMDSAHDPATACALIQEATGEERLSSDFYVV